MCKALAFNLLKFIDDRDPTNVSLRLVNYPLDDSTAKAVALTLPYMHEIKEIELKNNKMTD